MEKKILKNDLLEKIKSTVDFSTYKNRNEPLQKGKTFFEIVRFKKTFYSGPESLLNKLLFNPLLTYTTIIKNFEWVEVNVSLSVSEIKAIMKILNHDNITLKEGDSINIRISDFQKDLFSEGELIDNILKTAVLRLFSSLNFNFTFLIELDPIDENKEDD